MQVNKSVKCVDFPCLDVNKDSYIVPSVDVESDKIAMLMISEAPPTNLNDYFYTEDSPFYFQTTVQAFNDAGITVSSIKDVLELGVYITTAVKCGKTAYSISSSTVESCSDMLEREMNLFPNVRSILLIGDTAIKAMNYIARRNVGKRVVPRGSTYKIRKNEYFYNDVRVFPSYLQTGKSYLIEKSKRKMIAEDIKTALEHH